MTKAALNGLFPSNQSVVRSMFIEIKNALVQSD